MFDKDLFFSLCEKYNVELSEIAEKPMIRDGAEVRAVTGEDVNRIFISCQTYFAYSNNSKMIHTNVGFPEFYVQESYAAAC